MGCHLSRDDWMSVNREAGFPLSLVAGSHPGRGLCFKPPLVPKHGQRRTSPLNEFFFEPGGRGDGRFHF